MKKKLFFLFTVMIFLAAYCSSAAAITIFEENFESGDISNWIQYDTTFTVQDFQGSKVLSGNGSGVAYIDAPDWTDYTVEGDYYLWNGNYWAYAFGLLFRAEGVGSFGGMNGYNFNLRPYGVQIEKWTRGSGWSYLANKSTRMSQLGRWYHFKAVVEGAKIKTYIDDILIFDLTDSQPILNGGVGMRLWGAGAYLDNIKVTIPGIDVCEELSAIKEDINSLDSVAFRRGHDKYKKVFGNKLDEVCTIVEYAQNTDDNEIRGRLLDEANTKLQDDILAKMDSSTGGMPKNDWIIDVEVQSKLYPHLMIISGSIDELK